MGKRLISLNRFVFWRFHPAMQRKSVGCLKGFTVIEVLIVGVIISILISIAAVNYFLSVERNFNQEAIVNARLMRAAEKDYYYRALTYTPAVGSENDVSVINANLRLNLVENNWDYRILANSSGADFVAGGVRITSVGWFARYWAIQANNDSPCCGPSGNWFCPGNFPVCPW